MLARQRTLLVLSGLALLAVAGQLVLNQAAATLGRMAGYSWNALTTGFDFVGIWEADWAFMHGKPFAWYGTGVSNAWPPPHEVLFAPLGFLSYDAAHIVTTILTAVLMVFTVALWSRERFSAPMTSARASLAWPIVLSAPVIAVVWIDQLQAALGLAALSLAIWAQRREKWWLVGIAASLGMIRVLNAIPLLAILLLSGWGKPRQLAIAAGAGAACMAPLLFVSYLWDHTFITDYIAGISAYPFNGTPKLVTYSLGPWGIAILMGIGCAAALWLVRRDVGQPLDAGRAGLAMSLTVPLAPLGGLYPAIFTLPALMRLAQRPGFWAIAWIASVGPWVLILLASPWLLGHDPGLMLNFVSFIDYGLLLLAYPLLRIPPEAEMASAGRGPADARTRVA